MALAALVVSIVSLLAALWLAVRQQRLQRKVSRQEQLDRREQLALQRHELEHTEAGWRRWGPGPPAPPGDTE